ncbi:MAG TPA: site-specific integrase [Verrucomicrobiae bacterium]|jgi:integrase
MKTTEEKQPTLAAQQPVFHKVAENLYRLESSGGYYALVKRGGKQFRRSLKTKDRKLADRRLTEIKEKIGCLSLADEGKLGFEAVAKRWLESVKHTLAAGTIEQREIRIKNLAPFFKGTLLRSITAFQCEQWAVKRGAKLAPQTFVHELETMRNVFKYAQQHGLVLSNPASVIKRPKVSFAKAPIPTRQQFVKLVAQIRQSDGRADSQRKSKDGADLVEFLAFSGARIGEARAAVWGDVKFQDNMIWIHGTKSEQSDRLIPMTASLREFLLKLKAGVDPEPTDRILKTGSAKKCLATACANLEFPKFSHHDFRHFFATTCIESGVDIPTVSRWLGHSDGGALAMRVYGHLQVEHSLAMGKRVSFDAPSNVIPMPRPTDAKESPSAPAEAKRVVAKAKAKYGYPWWASENPLEVFWGQLNEETPIIPIERFLEVSKKAMGREVLKSELADHEPLVDELSARIPAKTLDEIRTKTRVQNATTHEAIK